LVDDLPQKMLNERLETECQLEPDLTKPCGSLFKNEKYEKR
jgi:hypothetical protein